MSWSLFKMRGDSSFCWCRRNCWPSLSFHLKSIYVAVCSFHQCILSREPVTLVYNFQRNYCTRLFFHANPNPNPNPNHNPNPNPNPKPNPNPNPNWKVLHAGIKVRLHIYNISNDETRGIPFRRENLPYSKFDTLHEVMIYNCSIYFLTNKTNVYMNIIIQFRPSTVTY